MNRQKIDGQRGFALAVVMMILLVLLILSTAVLFSTATNATITGKYRISNETFAIANAGLEKVINWFSTEYDPLPAATYSITPAGVQYSGKPVVFNGIPSMLDGTISPSNFPKNDLVTNFMRDLSEKKLEVGEKNYGKYSVNATMVSIRTTPLPFGGTESIERWQIDVRASEPDAPPNSQITALIEVGTPAFFGYAIKADERIDIDCKAGGGGGGGKDDDDDDDDDGDDGGGGGSLAKCLVDSFDSRTGAYSLYTITGDPASLASNDIISLDGNVLVKGDADYLNKIAIGSGVVLTGKQSKITSRISFSVFNPVPSGSPSPSNVIVDSANATIGPGVYARIEVKNGYVLKLDGAGVYYAQEVIVDGSASKIKINPAGEPGYVTLLINGKLELRKAGEIATDTAPNKMLIYAKGVKMREKAKLSAALYSYTTDDTILDVVDSLKSGEIRLEKESEIFGAVVTKSFSMKDNSKVHYDISLYDKFKNKNRYRVLYWTYKNFF